jgi:S1-C subfamily serine protease
MDWIELADKQHQNTLTEAEKQLLKQKLEQEENWAKQFYAQIKMLQDLEKLGKRKALKAQFKQLHQELQQQQELQPYKPKVAIRYLWKRHFSTAAIAASVALMTVFAHIYVTTNYLNKQEKIQKNNYVYLKRQVDNLKKKQEFLQNNISTQNNSPQKESRYFSGTAFAIAPDGWVATSYHLIENARKIRLSNHTLDVTAEVIFADKKLDLAILKINDTTFKGWRNLPYSLKKTTSWLGEDVFTLAQPDKEPIYAKGSISAINGFYGDTNAYQVSIPVNPGNSGSPVFDQEGNVIGVLSGKQSNSEGVAFVVKTKAIQELLKQQQDSTHKNKIAWKNKKNYKINYKNRVGQLQVFKNFVFNLNVEEM